LDSNNSPNGLEKTQVVAEYRDYGRTPAGIRTACLADGDEQGEADSELEADKMTAAIDHPQTTVGELHQPAAGQAGGLLDLTPEAACRLAARLAPHLLAMRAVTAGTSYEHSAGSEVDDETQPVSPAIKIFIAGMLERLPA
jgi:hypothetical protein